MQTKVYEKPKRKKTIHPSGEVGRLFQVSADIGKLRQAEEALRESEERFKQIFEILGYTYIIAPDGRILDVNRAALKRLGLRREELIGKHVETIYAPESQAKAEKLMTQWKKTGILKDEEMVILSKTGERRTVLLSSNTVRNQVGEGLYKVSVQKDITRRKEVEDVLREKEERLRGFMASATDALSYFDSNLHLQMANDAALKLFRTRKREALGKHMLDLAPHLKIKETGRYDKYREVLKTGKPFLADDVVLPIGFKVRHWNIGAFKVGTGLGIIARDVTAAKEVDQMKTEFVSIVSHQLRTPLAAMKLFLEMLLKERVGTLNTEQKGYLENVYSSSERMVGLVNELLDVSQLETGKVKVQRKRIQMEDLIQNLVNESHLLVRDKGGSVVFEKPTTPLSKVFTDPTLMRQVIHNLITNGIRYSKTQQCHIVVKIQQRDCHCLISVQDKGIGIPKEIWSRIFEKFFRSGTAWRLESEGSGLGLYVVKMIVERLDGRIWFTSKIGRGTTFYILCRGAMPLRSRKD